MTFSMMHIQNWSSPPPYPLPWETGYLVRGGTHTADDKPKKPELTAPGYCLDLCIPPSTSFPVSVEPGGSSDVKRQDLCKIRVSILRGVEVGDHIVSAALACAQMWEFPSLVPAGVIKAPNTLPVDPCSQAVSLTPVVSSTSETILGKKKKSTPNIYFSKVPTYL